MSDLAAAAAAYLGRHVMKAKDAIALPNVG
jgi:hypothetical protein